MRADSDYDKGQGVIFLQLKVYLGGTVKIREDRTEIGSD